MSTEDAIERHVTLAKYDNPLHARDDAGGRRALSVELPRLSILVEKLAGVATQETRVFDADICRIGSHESNDVVLEDETVSRFHCRITREGGAWRITDLGSTNGTRLSGVKVLVAELDAEGVVSIGNSVLRVRPASSGRVSVQLPTAFGAIIGQSPAMQRLFDLLERIAKSDIDALVQGESGTGKELVATELVSRSPRAEGPVVVVDCGAMSPSLVESELFGHVRGAFTGADRDRAGAFEAADGGTVFLDEIGELPLALQPKLLRVLEAREIRRLGETKSRKVDVRIIAATHRDLEREVNRGRFREDLYYRLAKVSVRVPPLRERLEDLPLLAAGFLSALGIADQGPFGDAAFEELKAYDWPGNVRELKNYVERCVVLDDAPPPSGRREAAARMDADDGPKGVEMPVATGEPVPFRAAKEAAIAAFERAYLGPLLARCNGNVSRAARLAQMDRMYLHQRAQKYGFTTTRKA